MNKKMLPVLLAGWLLPAVAFAQATTPGTGSGTGAGTGGAASSGSMTLPAIRRITLIFDRYCSTRGAVSLSMSSRCITSFLT